MEMGPVSPVFSHFSVLGASSLASLGRYGYGRAYYYSGCWEVVSELLASAWTLSGGGTQAQVGASLERDEDRLDSDGASGRPCMARDLMLATPSCAGRPGVE